MRTYRPLVSGWLVTGFALAGLAGPAGLAGAPAGAAGAPASPAALVTSVQDGDSTLTWSVRPTPTEEEPERPNFAYDLDPGARVEDSLRVRNFGTEPLSLAVYASDALTTSTGALDLLPAGEAPTGVGAWIVLDTAAIEVPPQDFVDVPFTIVVPAGAESGDHTGGVVTSFRSPGLDASGQAVVVDRRLGSRVQVRVGGELRPELSVTEIAVSFTGTANPLETGDLRVTYTVANTGNVRLGAQQRLVVPGRLGLPGRELILEPMPELLPDNSLRFSVDVPAVWPTFRTTATVELRPVPTRAGDVFDPAPLLAAGSTATWSMPWSQLAIVLGVAGIVLWLLHGRRRRRSREAAATREVARTAAIVQEAVRAVLAAQDAKTGTPTPDQPAVTRPAGPAG